MSEPLAGTGNTKPGTCSKCGTSVELQEHIGMYKGGTHWHTPPHTAPCGLDCFGGGARGPDGLTLYKAGQMHGLKTPCPACEVVSD